MYGINQVVLVGRLGKDPERKHTTDGKEFSTFRMATSEKWTDGEKTTWHTVVVWNEVKARYVNSFAQRATMVAVVGQIDNRQYTKLDGSIGYASDVVVGQYNGTVEILTDGVPRASEARGQPTEPKGRVAPKQAPAKQEPPELDPELNDDIPF